MKGKTVKQEQPRNIWENLSELSLDELSVLKEEAGKKICSVANGGSGHGERHDDILFDPTIQHHKDAHLSDDLA